MKETLRFYLITGLDSGREIKPFIIESTIEGLNPYLNVIGDAVRYYEPISERQVIDKVREGVELR